MSLKTIINNKERDKKHFKWGSVEVFIKDPIQNKEISLKGVLDTVARKIPHHLLSNIETIYVGDFSFLKDRGAQAVYENSCIFVTNEQSDQSDMCDDIIHEIAHSVEEINTKNIYEDGLLEREFVEKRKQLFNVLKSEGFEVEMHDFIDPDYNKNFDDFLYMDIGYPMLTSLSVNIFYSPYAATSLREYFANGFEAFFYYDGGKFLKMICPILYQKMNNLLMGDAK